MIRLFLLLTFALSLFAGTIRFGYGSDAMNQYNKKDTMIAMEVWVKEFMKGDEDTVVFSFYDSSQKMAEDLEAKKLDMVLTLGLDFVKYFGNADLANGMTAGMRDRESERLVLLVNKESSKEKLLSLKKPTIAVQADEEIAKIYAKNYFLKNTKKEDVQFLNVRKRQEAILKVFFKNADAALVTKKTFLFAKELNPQIGEKLKIIEYSDITATSFGFFRKSLNEKTKEKILSKAINLNTTVRGRQILAVFQTDMVVETSLEDLKPIKKLYDEYNELKNTKTSK